ncbi:neurexin-4-like isoform X1 [Portunus trituberculatus]|uniref:neurexin-4-like isoform X1 n=1 Tax=Portunus trituberculatus TaxID=210409 RepID=UPI001E1D1909|nr:neurexin-4-like isoform X1 [Portunus trituberculatus]
MGGRCLFSLTALLLCPFHILAEYCEYPLVEESMLTASSELVTREADKARLYETTAWTARNADYLQYIESDLGDIKNVTAIATQGRDDSQEYVTAYTLEYSRDGIHYSIIKGPKGNIMAFPGNEDGNTVAVNLFETPIIGRYIRVKPTRWRDRISMRVELYGCEYLPETVSFNGNAMVVMDLRKFPVNSLRDHIRFRFRTKEPNAMVMYGRGTQGDYLALQLVQNRMVLNVNLGSRFLTSLSVGSLLDDNSWHDVEIRREQRNITFLVDRVRVDEIILGDFKRLNLNKELYIGGVPNLQLGMKARVNFTGCMENLFINGTAIVPEMRESDDYYSYYNSRPKYSLINIGSVCEFGISADQTMTFTTRKSHLKYPAFEDQRKINVSLEFRTYEEKGLLIHHKFTTHGYFMLFLDEGKVKVEVNARGTPGLVVLDNFETRYNDGQWHKVMFVVMENRMELTVDEVPMQTVRIISVISGKHFLIAGGVKGSLGFLGCLRKISVVGYMQKPKDEEIMYPEGIVRAACQIMDRCNPNPCEHRGRCKQTSLEFICDCTGTGYSGAVCHTPLNPISCAAYGLQNPGVKRAEIYVDVDGSGPLVPFPVSCEFYNDGQVHSYLSHKHEKLTTVDGFEKRGSYVQNIIYDAGMEQIEIFVNRSARCRQRIHFECLKAKLFNSPSQEDEDFLPYTWWVSRTNQPMDYWGGSLPGSRKCECGLTGTCVTDKWCNCDAGLESWISDSGELSVKEHLPVRQLRIGDTGTPLDGKKVRYTLGPLICEGDHVYDNTVTFRRADATINLPRFDMGHSGDIFFEFKTTTRDGCLIHAKGPSDYIKISIVGGIELQFQYEAGSGPMSVSVETSNVLNDDTWHSVLVERNRKEARMIVDGGQKGLVAEPYGPVRAIHLESDFVVGATLDYRDGFVGCIRALILNGELQDLRGRAEKGMYGVQPGCIGKCSSNPCLNNGTCHEGYSTFECDCRWTAFKGPICADEIGIKMLTDTMVRYEIPGTYKTTIAERIRVGFTTTNPRGFLIGLHSNLTGEYLTLAISNSGHLKVTFDFGFERHEKVYGKRTFHEGQNHDVKLYRSDSGRRLTMQVDNYEPVSWTFDVKGSADAQFNNIQYVYIGKNESMAEGFVGCISRVEFDDIYPLKLYFQQDRPLNVLAESTSSVFEDYCGIEPIRYPEEEAETRRPPVVSEEVLMGLYSDNSAVLGGVLGIIFLALLCMGFLIGRYMARHKGDYRTQEADGADMAPDADWAVQHATTGPQVKKNTEMYI